MGLDAARVLGLRHGPVPLAWTAADASLYASAVGAGDGPAENASRRFPRREAAAALPTFAATLARRARPDFAALGIDPARVLHLSQGLRLDAAIPIAAQALAEFKVIALYDAGPRGAILDTRTTIRTPAGNPLALATSRYLARGAGGFGGTPTPVRRDAPGPSGAADVTFDCPVRPDQAVLYRRLGDDNRLHVDPEAARRAGFDAPILHGLCTFGIVGLAVVNALCDGDPGRLAALELDFRAPVYPGEALRFEAWRDPGGATLRLVARERGGLVTALGRCGFASPAQSSSPR